MRRGGQAESQVVGRIMQDPSLDMQAKRELVIAELEKLDFKMYQQREKDRLKSVRGSRELDQLFIESVRAKLSLLE